MPLETRTQYNLATHDLWLVAADESHMAAAAAGFRQMAAEIAENGRLSAILLLPLGTQGFDMASLEPEVLEEAGLDLGPATHGTVLMPGDVRVLPAQRLFVLEDGELKLRPRDTAQDISVLDHLLPTLASRYGARLHAVVMAEDTLRQGPGCASARSCGGAIWERFPSLNIQDGRSGKQGTASAERATRATTGIGAGTGPQAPRPMAHDLRQPLQTLTLLQTLLARQVNEPRARQLVSRLGETVEQLVAILSQPDNIIPQPGDVALAELPLQAGDRQNRTADRKAAPHDRPNGTPIVYIIDDDRAIRDAIRSVLEEEGLTVRDFDRCEAFLSAYDGEGNGCLLVDAYLPGMSGIDLLEHLRYEGIQLPSIVITGSSDVQMAVRAMKTGASDFVEKPVGAEALIAGVRQALTLARDSEAESAGRERAAHCLKSLTRRQKQIMAMVLDGHPSKNIAADLGISQRTVENHRAAIMKKTGSRSLPALARLALSLPQSEIE